MKRVVFLDPDGTLAARSDWLVVIVEAPTSVVYESQSSGTAVTLERAEGYLVPLSCTAVDPTGPDVTSAELSGPFHDDRGACRWHVAMDGTELSKERLDRLSEAVARVAFWFRGDDGEDRRAPLRLDAARLDEVREAWVPVLLPDGGRAILAWPNCD